METPKYIQALFKPRQNGKAPSVRRVWGLDLQAFWVPVLTATNVVNLTDIPSDALGAPLRLNLASDGSVKFQKSGRPSYGVAKPIRDAVKVAQENFEAENLLFVANVQKAHKEEYKAEVMAAYEAGKPINEKAVQDIADAIAAQAEETPAPAEAEPVAA